MTRPHQPGQAVFRSILPEDIDWQPFPAFPPAVRLAVIVGHPSEPGPLRHQGEGARRHKTDAAQASGGPGLHGHVGRVLHRPWRLVRRRQGAGFSAGKRDRAARQHFPFPLGEIRRIRHASNGDRPARH